MEDECVSCGVSIDPPEEGRPTNRDPYHRDFCVDCVDRCIGAITPAHCCMVCMDTGDR